MSRHSSMCFRFSRLRDATVCRLLASLALVVCVPAVAGRAQTLQFGADVVEQPPEKLRPRSARSEQDEDRLFAAAQYAYGRMLMQRDDLAGALRRFQRAWRYDPQAVSIARDIVSVASRLNRNGEAARYAILAAEQESDNPELLRQLGEILIEQGELERAARMFEKASARLQEDGARTSTFVLMQAEIGRLYLVLERFDLAAAKLAVLGEAFEEPEKHGFEGDGKAKLLAERGRLLPLVGESLLRVGKLDDAARQFERAHAAQPNEPLLAFRLARVEAERHQWEAARRHLERYLSARATSAGAQPYELLARIVAAEVQDDARKQVEVIAELSRWHATDSDNVPLAYFLADRLLEARSTDRALPLLERLLVREPRPFACRELASIYHERQDPAALLGLLGRAFTTGPSLDLLTEDGRKIARDASFLKRLAERLRSAPAEAGPQPGKWPVTYGSDIGVALLAMQAGEGALVEECWQRALQRPQAARDRVHESIGLALVRSEQPVLAGKVFAQAIAEGPARPKLAAYYFYLAACREFGGDTPGALEAAEKCAELAPDVVQFQTRAAWVLYHAKRWSEAEQRYRAVLDKLDQKFDSEEVRDQMRQTRLVLSNICVMQQRLPEAEEWLEQVLDEFPEDLGAQNDLGYLWADQGKRLQRALAMCQRAVRGEQENGAYRDSLGWALFRLERYAEAIDELEAAARLTPDGVIFDHLGDAYWGAKQNDKALDAWQRAAAALRKENDPQKLKQVEAKIEKLRSP